MPRAARLDAPELLQHVIVRGIDRCVIFVDDTDRHRFVGSVSRLLGETGTQCLAWTLMPNHSHLLLRLHDTPLALFMRRLLTGYAIYFNLRHNRSGHLFQNRYRSIVCEEESYLLELIRYIHLNPLRGGIVHDVDELERYPWCGHGVITGVRELAGQAPEDVLSLFRGKTQEAVARYRQFVADGVALGRRQELGSNRKVSMTEEAEFSDVRILGSGEFISELQRRQELEAKMPHPLEIHTIVARVCTRFGILPEALQAHGREAALVAARSVICYLAVRRLGHNGVAVGGQINLQRAGVSQAARRGERMVRADPVLLELINN